MTTHASHKPNHATRLPRPIVRKMRWPVPIIWIVPILAAVGAGFYLYDFLSHRGPVLTIQFTDATGLKQGETAVCHHGVQIGNVTNIALAGDQEHVLVQVRLARNQVAFSRQGTLFWVVRPEISEAAISGLSTVISGPYIEAEGGAGDSQNEFIGLPSPPVTLVDGVHIVLYADQLEHLQPNSPIYYRGIQVGVVERIGLNQDATRVEIQALIWRRYANLIRPATVFWRMSGVDVEGGLFSGLKLNVDSLKSLIAGGIGLATPNKANGAAVNDGAAFPLRDEAPKDWANWSPNLPIKPADSNSQQNDGQQVDGKETAIQRGSQLLRSTGKAD